MSDRGSIGGPGREVDAGVDFGVLILAAVYFAVIEEETGRVRGAWCGEYGRSAEVGRRADETVGLLGTAQRYSWLADWCKSAIARTKQSTTHQEETPEGRKVRRQRLRELRAKENSLRWSTKRVMRAGRNSIARAVVRVADRVVLGDLGLEDIAKGKRGAAHTRRNLCALGQLRDRFVQVGGQLGVQTDVVDEGGTTGTCPWCLKYEKKNSAVRTLWVCIFPVDVKTFRVQCCMIVVTDYPKSLALVCIFFLIFF